MNAAAEGTRADRLPALEQELRVRGDLTTYQYRLPNGLAVFLTPNAAAPSVSIVHWVKAGSLHETPGITGIAHLFEHMMFRPVAPGRPGFMAAINRLGGSANANTRFVSTVYTTTVPRERLREALRLEAERWQKLRVTDALLDVERKAVWSEYSTKLDSVPLIDLWDGIYRAAFPGHPFGWFVVGFREDLEKITARDCRQFFARLYVPGNTGLFVAGDVDRDETLRQIVAAYGSWKPGPPSTLPPAYQGPRGYLQREGKLTAGSRDLMAGFRLPELDRDGHQLAAFIDHVLFNTGYSLARRRLRDRLKLVSDVDSFNFTYDSGMLKALANLLPDTSYPAVVEQLLQLPADFKALGEAEYQAYLREYQVNMAESLLRNEALNERLALHWGKFGDARALVQARSAPLPIDRASATAFVESHLVKDNLVVITQKSAAPAGGEKKP